MMQQNPSPSEPFGDLTYMLGPGVMIVAIVTFCIGVFADLTWFTGGNGSTAVVVGPVLNIVGVLKTAQGFRGSPKRIKSFASFLVWGSELGLGLLLLSLVMLHFQPAYEQADHEPGLFITLLAYLMVLGWLSAPLTRAFSDDEDGSERRQEVVPAASMREQAERELRGG